MNRLDMKRIEREMRWAPWTALAALIAAGVVFVGGVIAVSNWVRPLPQTITVHILNEPKK